jgi:hypothetical protein
MSRQHRLPLPEPDPAPLWRGDQTLRTQVELSAAARQLGLAEVDLHCISGRWDPELRLTLRGEGEIRRVLRALQLADILLR